MPGSAVHLEIRERVAHRRKRLSVLGELDLSSAPVLEERLDELRASRIDVWLDLSKLDFIDSSGLRVVIAAAIEGQRAGWRIDVEPDLSPSVWRLFELSGADALILGEQEAERYLDLFDSVGGR